MPIFIKSFLVIIFFGFSTVHAGEIENDPKTLMAEMIGELKTVTRVPAFSFAVVSRGKVVIEFAIGEKDIKNNFKATPATTFRLASVSKVIGAAMLGQLVQEGLLDPDAPITDYLPELPQTYNEITARQLLAHLSGLPHYQARDAFIESGHYDNALQSLATVGNRDLVYSPGEIYLYSTHGFTILGALYEKISQKTLKQAVPDFIVSLTGRKTPELEDITKRASNLSNVFDLRAGGPETIKMRDQTYSPFGTGFIATAGDLALFGDRVFEGNLFTQETKALFLNPATLKGGGKTGNYLYEVSFGWRVGFDSSGREVVHHAGITQGARAILIHYPKEELTLSLLSNARWTSQIERTGFSLADILLDTQIPINLVGEFAFEGVFDGSPIKGTLKCPQSREKCLFSDQDGAFSKWVGQYNYPNPEVKGWPAFFVNSREGVRIKLVTPVGFADFRPNPKFCPELCFVTEFGDGRSLSIRFENPF